MQNELERSLRRLQIVDDRLAKTRILAPFDGTVLEVLVSEGQVVVGAASVNSGTGLMTLANLSSLVISTHVNQLDASRISEGAEVTVIAPNAGDDGGERLKIDRIAPLATVKNNIKGFAVTGSLDGAGHNLKPGLSVSMRLPVGFVENAISVPLTSVFEEGGENVVYVSTPEGIERRKVEVGLSDSSRVEITGGLIEGEEVLTEKPSGGEFKLSRS
jgi:Membrane-fusion protein